MSGPRSPQGKARLSGAKTSRWSNRRAVSTRQSETEIDMRTTSKTAVAASLAALLLGLTATASNADGRWSGGGWHHGWHGGGWGPAVGLGIAGGLATGAIIGSMTPPYAYNGCYQSQPIYDAYGNYVGNQTVNVC
jgi:hypothetical protein